MKKVYEQMLAEFKKSNKERKEAMAKEFGKTSAAELLAFLNKKLGLDKSSSKVKGDSPKPLSGPKEIKTISKPTVTEEKESISDVVVAFDTTGSMNSYIQAVREHVIDLIPRMFENTSNLRMSIVAFGDYCDMDSPTSFGTAYQLQPLTDDQSKLITFVQKAKATGGGDTPEFYELVMHKIIEETPWREGSVRSVLLIGDYGPHHVGYSSVTRSRGMITNQIDWKKEAVKAKERNIKFDTLRIRPSEKWYQELSEITGGVCVDFQSGNTSKVKEIIEATTYSRSSSKKAKLAVKEMFTASFMAGDTELTGMYKNLGETLD